MFCTWINYNIHIIRQVALYCPSNGAADDRTASSRKLRGLAAVEASNAAAAVDLQFHRNSGGSVRKKGVLGEEETME